MNDLLRQIVDQTRDALRDEQSNFKALEQGAIARSKDSPRRFSKALAREKTSIKLIAEVKSASPSAGTIVENPDVESIAASYREGGAAAISVVTEPRFFRGSRDWLRRAAEASGLPVLMKDFIIDMSQIYRAVLAGADGVLLITAILDSSQMQDFIAAVRELGRDPLVEVHDEAECEAALKAGATIVGVNNRNLHDFSVDLATSERLAPYVPGSVLRVSESGIKSREDVERLQRAGFDAILVGESLLREKDRKAAVRKLLGAEEER